MSAVAQVSALVRRASDLSPVVAGAGVDRLLPVRSDLQPLLPFGGLRRGSTVGVAHGGSAGAMSLMLALIAEASAVGSWCAIVGAPHVGLVAAAELGVVLERTALIPYPGAALDRVVGTLLDGFDIVVAAIPAAGLPASLRGGWTARARRSGGVLIPWCDKPGGRSWEGADLVLSTRRSVWHGLGQGVGRLRARELTVAASGRGAAARPREATIWLPRHPTWQPPFVEEGQPERPALRLVS
jgi:hypothetical protein